MEYATFESALTLPSPLIRLDDERLSRAGLRVWLKRDDLIHPDVPGNKWRKLKHNLAAAQASGHHTLLTFGGAYSNHLRATAAAGRLLGFGTIGVVRGEAHLPLNPSLEYAVAQGMRLTYLDRASYRRKSEPTVIESLWREFGSFYLLPEGGSNELAAQGCAELPAELNFDFDVICCPCGTGTTLAGLAAGLRPGQRAIGFSALKGGAFLARDVGCLQQLAFGTASDNWHIESDFHFGGFARRTNDLTDFITEFRQRHGVTLDWVYVAKMMYGVLTLAERGAFDPGSRIVVVVTG